MTQSSDGTSSPALPPRFRASSRTTLLIDRLMTWFVKLGGLTTIAVVTGIFIFILWQIIPLFQGAQITLEGDIPLPSGDYRALGTDEWSQYPFVLSADGSLTFIDSTGEREPAVVGCPWEEALPLPGGEGRGEGAWTAFVYQPLTQELALGTADGRFGLLAVKYRADYEDGRRVVRQETTATPLFDPLGSAAAYCFGQVRAIAVGGGDEKMVLLILDATGDTLAHSSDPLPEGEGRVRGDGDTLAHSSDPLPEGEGRVRGDGGSLAHSIHGGRRVLAARLTSSRGLLAGGRLTLTATYELTLDPEDTPERVAVSSSGDHLVVGAESGEVYYFYREGGSVTLRQRFRPFHDLPTQALSQVDFLFGGVSLVLTSQSGQSRIWSLYRPEGSTLRLFGQTKVFPSLPGPASLYAPSLRNKAFLIGSGSHLSLRFGTTQSVRWEADVAGVPRLAALSAKYDRLLVLDDAHTLRRYRLSDPHPEASPAALFGKLWYEGYSHPQYVWQSAGGTDDFEPKLSMIPLIWGTLKGTLFAMLFAAPLALLAAVYTSEFLHRRWRVWVKPTMEIMASLPSVVLGFLGALWLAPRLESRVPSLLCVLLAVPLAALAMGVVAATVSQRERGPTSRKLFRFRPGHEWIYMMPVFLMVAYLAWSFGPTLERWLCVTTDPTTGEKLADFRYWWPAVTGSDFQQRNSLVVGFMMGFAVIPVIFTIAEDALSNVPYALRSGSMALGANRWQTALLVVLPTASPGIFSGSMIGLGRAIGETMIVVMATGNTPILSLNPFNGMRTLSANIAVELPEAPFGGTLYRTLFLGALLLFILTFIVNTAAELLRQHLREKYKTV